MAIAVASGVTPERGLFTAVIGGILVSALGGSRYQIGGPAGAFILVAADESIFDLRVVSQYPGYSGGIYPHPPDLNLEIDPIQYVQQAVWVLPAHVACFI